MGGDGHYCGLFVRYPQRGRSLLRHCLQAPSLVSTLQWATCTVLHSHATHHTAFSHMHRAARTCTALHHIALICTVLHRTALTSTALHSHAPHCITLHSHAPHCTHMHRTALTCTVLQNTAFTRTEMHHTALICTALHHIVLIYTATMHCQQHVLTTARLGRITLCKTSNLTRWPAALPPGMQLWCSYCSMHSGAYSTPTSGDGSSMCRAVTAHRSAYCSAVFLYRAATIQVTRSREKK